MGHGDDRPRAGVIAGTVVTILSILLIILTVTAGRHIPTDTSTTTPTASTTADTGLPPIGEETRRAREAEAVRFEKLLRDWGADAARSPSDWADRTAADTLAALRTGADMRIPDPTAGTTITVPDGAGPDTPSPDCRNRPHSAQCHTRPCMRDWWAANAWSVGARFTDGPHAAVSADGTEAHVTGTVRVILLQGGDTFHHDDWWALTPAWRDYTIDDTLRFDTDGTITAYEPHGADHWWLAPALTAWDATMPAAMTGGHRVAIPVQGRPVMDGQWPSIALMDTPRTTTDMDGRVDFTLWGDRLCVTNCNPTDK